jgi:hypothetical protein
MKWAWIDMFKKGAEIYEKPGSKPTVIDRNLLKSLFSNFVYSRKKGYSVPFLRDHARKDSYIYGDIHNLRVKDGYVQALVTMTREEERQAYEQGIMREFSPGFDLSWFDPHTGEERGPALLELSYTGTAYQRNLRPPKDAKQLSQSLIGLSRGIVTHGEPIMARKKAFSQEEKEEIEELAINAPEEALIQMADEEEEDERELSEFSLNDIGAMMTEILGYLRPKEELAQDEEEGTGLDLAQEEEEEEKELSQDEEDEEKKALHRQIRNLEDKNTRMQLSQRGITGKDADNLVKLSRVDKDLYLSTVQLYSRQGKQAPIGVVGLDTTGGATSVTEVAKAAKAAGKVGPELRLFLSREYPEFEDSLKVNEVRKAIKRL